MSLASHHHSPDSIDKEHPPATDSIKPKRSLLLMSVGQRLALVSFLLILIWVLIFYSTGDFITGLN